MQNLTINFDLFFFNYTLYNQTYNEPNVTASILTYNDVYVNTSLNDSTGPESDGREPFHPTFALFLAMFACITIFGNLLVIVAVTKEIYLRTVTNYFIVSLATADLMVGAIVMPFSISHEMLRQVWLFGPEWCELWHSFDVLASTASILNLCVISLDRYWAITDPIAYPSKMSNSKVCILIALVWLCSAGISFPAIAWWKAVTPGDLPQNKCQFTDDVGYLIFSSFVSFYCPLIIMLFVYFKIYRAAAEQMRSLKMGSKVMSSNGVDGEQMTLRMHRGRRQVNDDTLSFAPVGDRASPSQSMIESGHCSQEQEQRHKIANKRIKQFAISKKLTKFARERKAAKTLGIVVGVFIVCWLPFFMTNVMFGLCHTDCVLAPATLFPIFTWLGYINSGMNPVIYALSMRDFRRAFTKIIFVCCPKYRSPRTRRAQYNHAQQASVSSTSFSCNDRDRCTNLRV